MSNKHTKRIDSKQTNRQQLKRPVVEIEHVTYRYDAKTEVLDNIQLTMNHGDFLGLVGPNGSGKSTLVQLILGLLPVQKGRIKLFGTPVNEFQEWSKVGYVSQKATSFNAGFPASVYEVVSTGLFGKMGLFRWVMKQENKQIMRALELVGMQNFAHRNIGKLSGGQQQRAFIARALVSRPQLLILDEPTVGVDAESVERFYELLTHLHENINISILMISHDIGVITNQVSQVACLNKQLFFHGDPHDFSQNQNAILSSAYGHDVRLLEHSH